MPRRRNILNDRESESEPPSGPSVVVNQNTITHTLPTSYYGFNFAAFFHQDAIAASWLAAMNTIAPEIMRSHIWGYDYNYTGHANIRNGFLALAVEPKVILQGDMHTNAFPSTKSPVDLTNQHSSSAYSPAGVDDLYASYINAGLDVPWFQVYNEPTNCITPDPTGSANSYYSEVAGYVTGVQPSRRAAEAFCFCQNRYWFQPVKDRAAAMGRSVRCVQFVWADPDASDFHLFSLTAALDGTPLPGGYTSPHAPAERSNLPWLDAVCQHVYPGHPSRTTTQENINSYFYPTYTEPKSSVYGTFRKMREMLDARGESSSGTCFDEGANLPSDRRHGAFCDLILAIFACVYQEKFNIEYAVFHSANRGIVGNEGHAIFDPTTPSIAGMNTRALSHRDMISPFIRLYKNQLIGGASAGDPPTAAVVNVGSTPGGAIANSITRIQCAAGLNAAGNKMAFLVANVDLSSAQEITLKFGTVAVGNATYRHFDYSAFGNKSTPNAGNLATSGNGQHTFTIDAGDVYFIEVPI